MIGTLTWVLLGIGAYWMGLLWLERRGELPSYLGLQGPIITVHTRRFRAGIDRIARPKRLWRAWGNFGLGVALVVMAGTFAFLAFAASNTVRNPQPSAVNQPRNVLVIPGVNDFLPLSVAPEIVLGLLVGLVVHEGGHGVLCRVGDIDIESMGLALFAVVPIGAFVEPDDESRRRADRGDQTRMFAAGVMNNFAVTVLAFGLLFGPVIASIAVAPGAAVGGVLPGSAAADAGIDQGDRIVALGGEPVADNADLEARLSALPDREVAVGLADGTTTTVRRSLLVTGIVATSPFAGPVDVETRIVAVNGTAVHTENALREALADREVASIRTADGATAVGPIGAAVRIRPDEPAAAAGLEPGTAAVITALDGQRVRSAEALRPVLAETRPGQRITIELYTDGERREVDVVLGENPRADSGYIGVDVAPGISGVTVSDFGTRLYPAGLYLDLLGRGEGGSFFGRIVVALQLPITSVTSSGIPFNFAGFTGGIANFYELEGPLAALGPAAYVIANALFWTGWINLNLGVFNCIPAFPLDGGHILRTSTESIVSRLPVRDRRRLTTVVTTSVGLVMLLSLLLTLFGPQLLT